MVENGMRINGNKYLDEDGFMKATFAIPEDVDGEDLKREER